MRRRPRYSPSWAVKFCLFGMLTFYVALAFVFLT